MLNKNYLIFSIIGALLILELSAFLKPNKSYFRFIV